MKKENLRDNMTNKELVLNILTALSTKEISEANNPNTSDAHKETARERETITRNARQELEARIGQKEGKPLNANHVLQINGKTK